MGLGRKDRCSTTMRKLPCLQDKDPDMQDLLKELQAQSQVAGWGLIALAVIGLMVGTSIHYCRSPVSFMQLKFWKISMKQECEKFTREATSNAAKLAEMNIKCFFEHSLPKYKNIPNCQDWQQISPLYTWNLHEQYYSMLHKYVCLGMSNRPFSEGNEVTATTLGFVDAV
ncbi:PREDICTED: protein FAM26F-like [Condylura cristata]|uniref:protein FAM26F-like n=1 Tax=Condylura cristata TaxID=143302 RepID=UPI00064289C7|nr:PREDICTED: protein FAM26F-like [Condylura cristata]